MVTGEDLAGSLQHRHLGRLDVDLDQVHVTDTELPQKLIQADYRHGSGDVGPRREVGRVKRSGHRHPVPHVVQLGRARGRPGGDVATHHVGQSIQADVSLQAAERRRKGSSAITRPASLASAAMTVK